MVKKTIQFIPTIAITMADTMSSCVDSRKDLYDPSYETPDPTGDGFAAPDGIDWNTITTENASVEVEDGEGRLFAYLVEIYAEDPLANESASVLAARTANKGNSLKSTTAVSLLPTQGGIYVEQTDPKRRERAHQFDVPENSDNITYELYYAGSTVQNRASVSHTIIIKGLSFERPDYYSIPANAKEVTEMSGTTLLHGTSHKIISDYAGVFKFGGCGGKAAARVYAGARWTVPATFQFQNGAGVIVMNNTKTEASGTMTFVRSSILIAMEKEEVNAENISFTNGAPATLRNWGTLTVTNTITLHSDTTPYNKGIVASKNISVDSNAKIVDNNRVSLEERLNLPFNFSLENNGEIYGEKLIASPDAVATDNNIMKFTATDLISTAVNSACSMGATTSFCVNGAAFSFTQEYLRTPEMEFVNGVVNLSNGFMLDAATSINIPSGYVRFYGKSENTPTIKSPVITGRGSAYDGDLIIECSSHVERNQWWENFHVLNGAYFTRVGDSKVIIDVCTGIKNGRSEGGDPEDPKLPITMDDNRNYAYLFENQQPLYGDYSMNDLVLIIRERKIPINKSNKAEEFTLSLDLSTAGATRSIGVAIMLNDTPASAITQPVEFSDNSLFRGFNVNSDLIENGQDYVVILLFDDAHKALGRDRYEQINTTADHSANTSPKNISFTIRFSNPISVDELNINKLNAFVFVGGNRDQRREIHIVGYQPTKLTNTDLFRGNNDDSSASHKGYYISKDNLA